MSALSEVFAEAAADYNRQLGGGGGPKALVDKIALAQFYHAQEARLQAICRSRPLQELCERNHIGAAGKAIIAREIARERNTSWSR